MKKFILSAALVIAFGAYVAYNYLSTSSGAQATISAPVTATAIKVATTSVVTTSPRASVSSGQYKDGTYTGAVENAYYGNLQVAATISGGKLTNVTFLQYPSDRSTSKAISQQAMPQLKAEAIQSQSANVDGVSGASDTSSAFNESLASALAQAKA